MRSWDSADFNGLIDIPEGKSGDFEIVHKYLSKGKALSTGNMRTALFGQGESREVRWDRKTRWHGLEESGSVWMTDYPIEQEQHRRQMQEITGEVLVGGLGLGVGATMLVNDPDVSHVTVIEKSADVIELVAPHISKRLPFCKLSIIHDDLFEYLSQTQERFDYAFYDIWTSDGEGTFFDMVLPLVNTSVDRGIVEDQSQVICWNEDVMRGQLALSLHTRAAMLQAYARAEGPLFEVYKPMLKGFNPQRMVELNGDKYHDWAVPFFRDFVADRFDADEIQERIATYAGVYGRPGWEGAFYEGVWS